MKFTNANLVFFSPTGTTHTILKNIALGMNIENLNQINLTPPQAREETLPILNDNILLLGVPVYEERIPPIIRPALEKIKGHGQQSIIVAVYGNVSYGLVLQELDNLLSRKGFNVIAGAAFIGEHSFSHANYPIVNNRPDCTDIEFAQNFGRKIAEKLAQSPIGSLSFPGHLPLMSRVLPEGSAANFAHLPSFNPDLCTHCGLCANNCPVSAINPETMAVDGSKCIRCFACVRSCRWNARSISLKHAWLVKHVLKNAATHRQEPQIFLKL
jgi:ferredoxin/NAD(P)H-dependent FMN reductase